MPKAEGQQINKKRKKESKQLDQIEDKGRSQKLGSDDGFVFLVQPQGTGCRGENREPAGQNALTSPHKTFRQNSSVVFKPGI